MTDANSTPETGSTPWQQICRFTDLETAWGEAALVDGEQVALFRTGEEDVFAVSNKDPHTGSNVIARGITGSRRVDDQERPTVASPLHKQVYDLGTGECYNDPHFRLRTFPARVRSGIVEVGSVPGD